MNWGTKLRALGSSAIDVLGLPALLLVLIAVSYRLTTSTNALLKDLGPNLISGFIGSAVTVYAIEFLQKRREKRRLLPVTASVFEDVRLMTDRALLFWKTCYQTSVGDGELSSWEDLLSESSIQKVLDSLDISRPPGIYPDVKWRNYFCEESTYIRDSAERVLTRHGMLLDPEIHNAVHKLVYYNYGTMIPTVEVTDRRFGVVNRPPILGYYIPRFSEYFDALLVLHRWTLSTYRMLLERGAAASVHEPYTYTFKPLPIVQHPEARYQPKDDPIGGE